MTYLRIPAILTAVLCLALTPLPVRAAPIFSEVVGPGALFAGVDVGNNSAPILVDIDFDGDLDAFAGDANGVIHYFRNDGTRDAPVFTEVTGAENPFNGIDVGSNSSITFGNLDDDANGDLDALIGSADGMLYFYRNTGTLTVPSFSVVTGSGNPFDGVDVGANSAPSLADIDHDGDLDAFIGGAIGAIHYFRNDGTRDAPSFIELTGSANPFNGVDVGANSAPTLGDIDRDGDLDAFIGSDSGLIHFFRNDGALTTPIFTAVTGAGNPLDGVDVGANSAPALGDVERDGDLDVFIGEQDGLIGHYRNGDGLVVPNFIRNDSDLPDVSYPLAPAFGDVDRDGDLDAVVSDGTNHILYYENVGGPVIPDFSSAVDIGIDTSSWTNLVPALGDLDCDGDPEIVFGESGGGIFYFLNQDSAPFPGAPQFTQLAEPVSSVSVGPGSDPALGDLDGDGRLDLVIGEEAGSIHYFRNISTTAAPVFVEITGPGSPFDGVSVPASASPTLSDLDRDGDLDLLVGGFAQGADSMRYYRNDGTPASPKFFEVTGPGNPFYNLAGDFSTESLHRPALADLDSDGDYDAFIGQQPGVIYYYLNAPAVIEVQGRGITIAPGDITPSGEDGTIFGSAAVTGETETKNFVIRNNGSGNLYLTGAPLVAISGPAAGDFSVSLSPATHVGPALTTTFQVRFAPSVVGLRTAVVSIASNDSLKNPYTFTISGTGTAPTIQFTRARYQVNEDGAPLGDLVTLVRSGDTDSPSQVQVSFSDGSAAGGTDYTAAPLIITFAVGVTTQTVSVPIHQDSIPEMTENLSMTLTGLSNAMIGSRGSAELQILDDDSPGYSFTPGTFTLLEGSSQAVRAALSAPPGSPVTLLLSSSDPAQCTVSPAQVTLDAQNWQSGVSFTVYGVPDGVADGSRPCTIITTASTSDAAYSSLNPADISLAVMDIRIFIPMLLKIGG